MFWGMNNESSKRVKFCIISVKRLQTRTEWNRIQDHWYCARRIWRLRDASSRRDAVRRRGKLAAQLVQNETRVPTARVAERKGRTPRGRTWRKRMRDVAAVLAARNSYARLSQLLSGDASIISVGRNEHTNHQQTALHRGSSTVEAEGREKKKHRALPEKRRWRQEGKSGEGKWQKCGRVRVQKIQG